MWQTFINVIQVQQRQSTIAGVKRRAQREKPLPQGQVKCARCGRECFSFMQVQSLRNEQVKLWFKTNSKLSDTDFICKACKISVTKKQTNPEYTPEKSRKKKRVVCALSNVPVKRLTVHVGQGVPVRNAKMCYLL